MNGAEGQCYLGNERNEDMKAIVDVRTDHTHVYGYVDVQILGPDGLVDEHATERLPAAIQDELREQWPSTSCRGIWEACERVTDKLRKLGFEIIDL